MTEQLTAAERAQKILDEVKGVRCLSGVNEKAIQFLRDMVARKQRTTSPKQEKWLADIERQVFPRSQEGIEA